MKYHMLPWAAFLFALSALAVPDQVPVDSDLKDSPPLKRAATVTVNIPSGGSVTGSSTNNVEKFNGIPFADPPVGPLRLRPPRRLSRQLGNIDGTKNAPACPQNYFSTEALNRLGQINGTLLGNPLFQQFEGQEDCLTIDVARPAGTKARDNLPVLFWIFGGGFVFGSTSAYDATSLLNFASGIKEPFVYVAVNYRLGGFGFLPGKEVLADGSSNLGLLDQRLGLQWVADNIQAFGGDASKVTIWGESAGSFSVFDQLLLNGGNATYNGKELFRGAIMNSGSALPTDPVDCPKGQAVYDQVVREAGCSGVQDTLNCLRAAPYATFLNAANSLPSVISYNSLAESYLPRPDGKVLQASPDQMLAQGQIHAVPIIIGDQEDEGTLFSFFQSNISTPNAMVDYLSSLYFSHATKDMLLKYVNLYEPALTQGSPFRTGPFNELYLGFKRVAAILGNLVFQGPRRLVLRTSARVNPSMPTWSYLASYNYGTPFLGTYHASDLAQIFQGNPPDNAMASCRTYYFNFLYNLDPNKGVGGYANWPQWKENQELMWFKSASQNGILKDEFRNASIGFLEDNTKSFYY